MAPGGPHPVRVRARRSATARRAVITALAGVLAAATVFGVLTLMSGSGDVEFRFGDERFAAGRVDALADEIAERGPFLVADASPRRDRDIYVSYGGGDRESADQWVAFAARVPGSDRACFLRWDAQAGHFVDPCGGGTYPADGEGLPRYPTTVEDGTLYVVLRQPAP